MFFLIVSLDQIFQQLEELLFLTSSQTFAYSQNWIQEASSCQHADSWTTQDKKRNTVIIEGELISQDSALITSGNHLEVLNMMADVMKTSDLKLIKSHPLILLNPLLFLLMLKMLFTWTNYRDIFYEQSVEKLTKILEQKNDGLFYVFTISEEIDNKKKLLGSVIFNVKKNYEYGTVELTDFVIKPEAQGRGLSTLLASSIFKLLPQTKRIVLDVNCSNDKAINVYESWGFTEYENKRRKFNLLTPTLSWYVFDYEYLTDKHSKLQNIATMFKETT